MTEIKIINHWIDGNFQPSVSDRFGNVYNPATGAVIAKLPMGGAVDLETAVKSARHAFHSWSTTSITKRAQLMFKFKELLELHRDELVDIISLEHGKVIPDAAGSLQRGIEVVEFACGIPHLLKGEFSEQVGTGVDCYSMRQPIGVCAGVTPFNFPAMVPMWMFPIAIVCGNCFILKPSEKDPSCSVKLAELLKEAGLPDGVMNVVHGDKEMVDAILEHPDIATFSFVGSTPVAEYVYNKASSSGKRVQALGGAKNHAVVMPDADLEQTANAIIGAAYGSAGERCMAISAVIAVDSIAEPLKEILVRKMGALKIGPGNDPSNDMGPLITKEHYKKMKPTAYIINAARGNIVDEKDLNDALNENLIAGAAIDVFSKEPAKENILFNNPKAILTPHIAASTTEASIVVAEMIANQISDFLLNGVKKNTV